MKRKTAKEILAESFRELAENKNIDKITIQEIADNCGYSPSTFYRNFKDKYDLIAWDHAQSTAEIMSRINADSYSWEQTLLDGALHFQENRTYLTNLFLHTTGQDSFVRYMTKINSEALKKHILSVLGEEALDEKTEMYIRIYCLGAVSLTCEWVIGRFEASPEDLAEIYKNLLPQPLRTYLL